MGMKNTVNSSHEKENFYIIWNYIKFDSRKLVEKLWNKLFQILTYAESWMLKKDKLWKFLHDNEI